MRQARPASGPRVMPERWEPTGEERERLLEQLAQVIEALERLGLRYETLAGDDDSRPRGGAIMWGVGALNGTGS